MRGNMKMMKWLIILLFSVSAYAQSRVAVTATITGSNGAPYVSGSVDVQLVDGSGNVLQTASINGNNIPQTHITAFLDVNGAFSVNLYPNSVLDQIGTQYKFNICSQKPSPTLPIFLTAQQCYNATTTITAAGSISTTLSASAPALYFVNPVNGNTYLNISASNGGANYVPPTGDSSGGSDCARIQNKCIAGGSVILGAGTYYIGKSNADCAISNPCAIQGQGPSATIIQNEGTTNKGLWFNAASIPNFVVPFATPYPSGGNISGFRIQQDPNVTPTAGACLSVGTNATAQTAAYLFYNIDIAGCYIDLQTFSGFGNDRFEQMTLSYPVSTNAVYYNSPAPDGDVFFDNIHLLGNGSSGNCTSAANFFINQGDTDKFRGIKVTCGSFVFGTGGSSNLAFTDIGVENGGLINCAFDFSAGSVSVYGAVTIVNMEFETGTTGSSHSMPCPVKSPQNVPTLAIDNAFVGTGANNNPSPAKVFNTSTGSLQVYDDFTGVSSIALDVTETNTVQPWTQFFQGTWNGLITLGGSNTISGSLSAYYLNMTPLTAAYTTQASCTDGSSGAGWCAIGTRAQSPSSSNIQGYACLFVQGTGVELEKFTGTGSPTQLGTNDTTFTGGTHFIGIQSTLGNVHTCIIDGKLSATATATDSTYTSAGFPWLAINQGSSSGYTINKPLTVQ